MIIKVYIYNILDGVLVYEDVGSAEMVIGDISKEMDFTLTPPPDYSQPWYWYDNAWHSEPRPTP